LLFARLHERATPRAFAPPCVPFLSSAGDLCPFPHALLYVPHARPLRDKLDPPFPPVLVRAISAAFRAAFLDPGWAFLVVSTPTPGCQFSPFLLTVFDD